MVSKKISLPSLRGPSRSLPGVRKTRFFPFVLLRVRMTDEGLSMTEAKGIAMTTFEVFNGLVSLYP
jgi:hypothetical protein